MTEIIKKQILEIRNISKIDMLNTNHVQIVALLIGKNELYEYIESNRDKYVRYIATGEED